MNEIWKDIPDYEGFYKISNLGNVVSLVFGEERARRFNKSKGYYRIMLHKNSSRNVFFVHRLVYITFIGQIPKDKVIDHVNNIPNDNRLENLQLLSCRDNVIKAKSRKINSSIHTGVQWRNDSKKWRSAIIFNGVRCNLGSFLLEKDASDAYQLAYNQILNGEFKHKKYDPKGYYFYNKRNVFIVDYKGFTKWCKTEKEAIDTVMKIKLSI